MRKLLLNSGIVFLLLFVFVSCRKDATLKDRTKDDKKVVYTSFYPIEYMTKRIVGDTMTVRNIVPQGQDVHDWELTAREAGELYQSDLLIISGAGLEPWLSSVQSNFDNKKIIDTSKGIRLIESDEHEENHDNDHTHEAVDPHYWMSPKQALVQAKNVYQGLVTINPSQKEYYKKNYDALEKELQELDKEYKLVASKNKHSLFVMHNAFRYWTRDYDIPVTALMGIHNEGGPDAKKMSEYIEMAKKDNIQVIYYNYGGSDKIAKSIAAEIKGITRPIYTMERITDQQKNQKEDYLSMMKKNLMIITRTN